MNLTHNGKIGRLPKTIREQLNRRLENGEKGRPLVAWLNSLPEVQALLAAEFEGKPIRQQNLSDWRKHGYAKWLRQREALDLARQLAADTGELQPPGAPPLADQMAVWLTSRYLVAVQKLADKQRDGELDLKVLRDLCHDMVAVRRGDHSGARLKLEQECLEREREKTEEEVLEHFVSWAEMQPVQDLICRTWVNPEERKRRLREIYGRPPESPEPATTDGTDENDEEDEDDEAEEIRRGIRGIYGLPPEDPAEDDADAETPAVAPGPVNGQEPAPIKPNQTT